MRATVVVSCYNQEKYIEECLDSIIAQETDFDFDIIVADDCSSDSTQSILSTYLFNSSHKNIENIELVLREKNIGAAKNYIDLHNRATGDIVFHFDGDDVMLPGKLQKQFDVFRTDETVNLVIHRANFFSNDGGHVSPTGALLSNIEKQVRFYAADLALWGPVAVHSSYSYRKKSRKITELNRDFMEWFFAMDSLLPVGTGVYINDVLVNYRCNLDGSSYLSSRAGRIKAYNAHFVDILYYFSCVPSLQNRLYMNYFVTSVSMWRAKCGFPLNNFIFLLKYFFKFRPLLLFSMFRAKRSVALSERMR